MLRLITPAVSEPISVDRVKRLLRIDHDALDEDIPGLISAARELIERRTGLALATASYEWTPVGGRTAPLPIWPADLDGEPGAYPVVFTSRPGPAPEPLKLAIVMLVGDMLNNPEAAGEKMLHDNPGFARLVFPYGRVLP
ncbi:phage gp6-like head-tail connector protein [Achromobacter spanius]|jgi:hypothetical protein|uniref:head-tail connector protein n=1 Tax=Achromobacter spanius TaxID=217203 RepID=UPI000F8FB445|nr:head-tail connector protein [Achromobacter spanius]AZS80673.1 phage gp6-like head-tail connector protein [Achromobacter spanius]